MMLVMSHSNRTIFDFNSNSQTDKWIIVDDGVMGGKSEGNFAINQLGHGVFHGNVSLENNGGFSMAVHGMESLDVTLEDTIVLRLKGDGKDYQLRIKDKADRYYSYASTFKTSGKWEEISIPLNIMAPTFRGRSVNKPNFDQNTMEEIAILIGNKKAQNFRLELDKITVH